MTRIPLTEIYEPTGTLWEISSAEESTSAGKVLGKVRGQFFVPSGISRNNRDYAGVWEHVLTQAEIQERLAGRMMFGMIGHKEGRITEDDLNEGRVSHIMTKLWIQGQKGMGEALILDTPAGRNLHSYLQAGSQLKTSSRAEGFTHESHRGSNVPLVDKESFYLETFDFVINPGFVETGVSLVEGNLNDNRRNVMPELNEQLMRELQESRNKLSTEVTGLRQRLEQKTEGLAEAQVKKTQLEEQVAQYARMGSVDEIVAAQEELQGYRAIFATVNEAQASAESLEECRRYGNLETAVALLAQADRLRLTPEVLEQLQAQDAYLLTKGSFAAQIEKMTEELEQYRQVGESPAYVETQIENAIRLIESWKALGTLSDVKRRLNAFEDYKRIAPTPTRLNEAMSELQKYRELDASPSKINALVGKAADLLEQYQKMGKPEEIDRLTDQAAGLLEEYQEMGTPAAIDKLMGAAADKLEEYQKLGTVAQIQAVTNQAADLLEEYQKLGKPRDIKKQFREAREREIAAEKDRLVGVSEEMAKKHSVSVETVFRLLESMNENEVDKVLKDITSTKSEPVFSQRKPMRESDESNVFTMPQPCDTIASSYFNKRVSARRQLG